MDDFQKHFIFFIEVLVCNRICNWVPASYRLVPVVAYELGFVTSCKKTMDMNQILRTMDTIRILRLKKNVCYLIHTGRMDKKTYGKTKAGEGGCIHFVKQTEVCYGRIGRPLIGQADGRKEGQHMDSL